MRFKTLLKSAAVAGAMMAFACGAHATPTAAVLYDNPYGATADTGSCLWSSTCDSEQLFPATLAAQAFNLSSDAILTSASFTELDLDDNAPTSVNWDIYADNVSTALPGTLIASGASSVSTTIDLGTDTSGDYSITQGIFSLTSVSLASGSYYLAIQGQSASFDDFLAEGVGATGAAQSFDGGVNFTAGYGQASDMLTSLAVSISGVSEVSAAPEPSSWVLMIFGVGVVGARLRSLDRKDGVVPA